MGKYFGREPRFSRAEIERQAQEAIEARVNLGRPPAEDWVPLNARLRELDRATAAQASAAALPDAEPLRIHEVRLPRPPAAGAGIAPAPRTPVAARPGTS